MSRDEIDNLKEFMKNKIINVLKVIELEKNKLRQTQSSAGTAYETKYVGMPTPSAKFL